MSLRFTQGIVCNWVYTKDYSGSKNHGVWNLSRDGVRGRTDKVGKREEFERRDGVGEVKLVRRRRGKVPHLTSKSHLH